MTLDLSGNALSTAKITWPRWGIPQADLVFESDSTAVAGDAVVLSVGDAKVTGTLRPGGAFGGTTYYTFVAGAARWDRPVASRSYHASGGVMLSQVFRDLVRETGGAVRDLATGAIVDAGAPAFAVLNIPDRSLGIDYTRRAGLASEALYELSAGQWYVDADGSTHIGPRTPRPFTASTTLTVDTFDPSTLAAKIRLSDDALAPLLPGCVLTAPGLPSPLTIGSVVINATPGSIDVDVLGERGMVELWADLARSLASPDLYARTAPMSVHDVTGALTSVVPIPGDPRSVPIPGAPLLVQIPGVPGCTATLAPFAVVLVGWPGADPSTPAIVGYVPGVLPSAVAFDATDSITVGEHATSVSLGVGGAAVTRVGDLAIRLYQDTVAHLLYVSTSKTAPFSWVPVASGIVAPTPADGGTPVTLTHGSAKVTAQ